MDSGKISKLISDGRLLSYHSCYLGAFSDPKNYFYVSKNYFLMLGDNTKILWDNVFPQLYQILRELCLWVYFSPFVYGVNIYFEVFWWLRIIYK